MPTTINPIITNAGLNAAIVAAQNALQLHITHIALGAGKYSVTQESVAGQTALLDRREKASIAGGAVNGVGSFRMSVLFPAWASAAYDACEVGFYAGDPDAGGILFAVYSDAAAVIVNRTNIDYTMSMAMQLTRVPAGSVAITVDPNVSQALALLTAHQGESNPHPQYVRHDTPQNLTVAAKKQARSNIMAAPGGNAKVVLAGVTDLVLADAGLIAVDASAGNVTINLPTAATLSALPFRFFRVDTSQYTVTINRIASDLIDLGLTSFSLSFAGDYRDVMADGAARWLTLAARSDGLVPGDIVWTTGNVARPGTVKGNGALLSRAAYPALFAHASRTGLVSENDWNNNGYFGRFSVGDGATTFRIPDLRAMSLKGLDDGRGIDLARGLGVYQPDQNRVHSHGAAAASGGNHNHPATSSWQADHTHTGSTDNQGSHSHPVNDPGHAHSSQYSWWTPDGLDYPGAGNEIGAKGTDWRWPTTAALTGIYLTAAGLHSHNVGIGNAGNHGHAITVDYGGAHSHDITVNNHGGVEVCVKNLAYLACIKF